MRRTSFHIGAARVSTEAPRRTASRHGVGVARSRRTSVKPLPLAAAPPAHEMLAGRALLAEGLRLQAKERISNGLHPPTPACRLVALRFSDRTLSLVDGLFGPIEIDGVGKALLKNRQGVFKRG
jgi:hypothetical protein